MGNRFSTPRRRLQREERQRQIEERQRQQEERQRQDEERHRQIEEEREQQEKYRLEELKLRPEKLRHAIEQHKIEERQRQFVEGEYLDEYITPNTIRQPEQTEEQRFEQLVHELEEKLKVQILPQRQQPEKISELTLEQHDQLILFTLSTDDRALEKKICENLPIVDIVDSMGSFVPQKYKMNVKKIDMNNGSYAASKRFLTLATVRKLKTGWSRQLLQTIAKMDLKDVEEKIRPKQSDLESFNKHIGIPRNSILHQVTDELRVHCGVLVSPMGRKDTESESAPVVHPVLCVSEDHFTKNMAFTDGTYKPSEAGKKAYKDAPRVSFNEVTNTKSHVQTPESTFSALLRKHHGLFLFLIGPAGSGKSTITKRMVKSWIEENNMAFLIPFAQIDKNERLNLKYLLTKFIFRLHNVKRDPSEEEIDEAFHWILANQDKCLLIFDGLDQSSLEVSSQPIVGDINDEFFPGDLLSLLMSRRFLPNCRLVLTSRPHSLVQLSPAIQPDIVIFLNDLLSDDVEKLMNHYLERGTASEIMQKLQIKSPRIYQLLFTPLFLRLVAMLNNEVGEEIWTYVNTTAKLFYEVIDRLQTSAHHECGLDVEDVEVLNLKLGEMALDKTMEGSVIFEQTDLEKYGLSGESTQDFLFGVMKQSASKQNSALLVGLMVFYFNHQSTQEFFSAKFAVEKLAFGKFMKFAEQLFPRIGKDDFGQGTSVAKCSFAILRVLTIGCLNESICRQRGEKEFFANKGFFISFLCCHIQQLFVPYADRGDDLKEHQKQIMTDLLDLREKEVVREVRENLKDVRFLFGYSAFPLKVAAQREGLFHFIQNFTSNIGILRLDVRDWSTNSVRKLFQAIQDSSAQIEEMRIDMHPQLEHVHDVVAILPHLTRKLNLDLPGPKFNLMKHRNDDVDNQFWSKLKEEITDFDTSKLQTEELEVKVLWLFKAVLRRGKPPQFTEEPFYCFILDE